MNGIAEGLSLIRWRRLVAHGPMLVWVCLIAFGRWGLGSPLPDQYRAFLVVSGVLAGCAMLFVGVSELICPRCSNQFHRGVRHRNDFTRRCLHCGLGLRQNGGQKTPQNHTR